MWETEEPWKDSTDSPFPNYASIVVKFSWTTLSDIHIVSRPPNWNDHGDPPLEWNSWIDRRNYPQEVDLKPIGIEAAKWEATIPTPMYRTWLDVYRIDSAGNRKAKIKTFVIEPDSRGLETGKNSPTSTFSFYTGEVSRHGFEAELTGIEVVQQPEENIVITHDKSRVASQSSKKTTTQSPIKVAKDEPEESDSSNDADVNGELRTASSLTKQRKSREAIRLLKKLMRDNSESFTKAQLYQINSLFEQLQRKPEAIDAATLLIKKYPDSPEAKLFKQLYKL